MCSINSAGELPKGRMVEIANSRGRRGSMRVNNTRACLHFLSSLSICFWPLTETGHREEGDEERD